MQHNQTKQFISTTKAMQNAKTPTEAFKDIYDIFRREAGCRSEIDDIEQLSWILCLKYIDHLERERKLAAELGSEAYKDIISQEYKWKTWVAPKGSDGKFRPVLIGCELKRFVDCGLFPYMRKLKGCSDSIECQISEIFNNLENEIRSGYKLRMLLDIVDTLSFSTHNKIEMAHLYENKIESVSHLDRMGDGCHVPKPLARAIVEIIAPTIGDKIYDGAVGSASFFVEAFRYLRKDNLTTAAFRTLKIETFYGKESNPLLYVVGMMNMMLNFDRVPHVLRANALAIDVNEISEQDRCDIVLSCPPFVDKEHYAVQSNLPIRTRETALLFLQHYIKMLKVGGRAAMIMPNSFLSSTNKACVALRRDLLERVNLHTVLSLPEGVFAKANVKAVVLFFDKGTPTQNIWFYQLNSNSRLTKPLKEQDLREFVQLQKTKTDSANSWSVNVAGIDKATYSLAYQHI